MLTLFSNNFSLVLPELYLFLSINILLMVGVYRSRTNILNYNGSGILRLSLLSLFFLIILYFNNVECQFVVFNYMFFSSEFILLLKILIIIFAFIVTYLSLSYLIEEKIYSFEYSILILLSVLGMLLLVSSYDFLSLYLALELQSLCFYILAAYKKSNSESTEASLKYFVLGAFSSGLLLFGLGLLYGLSGTTSFEEFIYYTSESIYSGEWGLAIIFILAGFLFKLSAAPFHVWTPDVYDGAPLIVVTFFATVAKIAAFGVVVTLAYKVFITNTEFSSTMLYSCSLISLFIGTFGALYQTKIKRLYAYSTINHVGFMLLGLSTISLEGLEASVLYLCVYLILNLTLFGVILSIRVNATNAKLVYLNEFRLLVKNNIVLAIVFTIALFSIAGIPPLMGFYSKYYVIVAAFRSEYYFMAIMALIFSVISAVYYIRLVVFMFFEHSKPLEFAFFKLVPFELSVVMSYTTLINVLFFVRPDNILLLCHRITLQFFTI